jgi:hypothetical protein
LLRRLSYFTLLPLLFVLPAGVGGLPVESASWTTTPRAVEPLSAAEERDPAVAAIARRFNPAMVLPDADGPWPVSVRYTWSGGADLQARTVGPDGDVLRSGTARASAELERTPWNELPATDPDGNRVEYWIDAPGDDRAAEGQVEKDGQATKDGTSEWRHRWRASEAKTPTQYAHAFWLNRARGELVVQYWFFYPFNEWINHHEGDWEHVNVVLAGPPSRSQLGRASEYRAVGYEYYFHGQRLDTDRPIRAVDDHPLVFVGGRGRVLWWSGNQSGGSYPWPASYPGAAGGVGPFAVSDDTRRPARVLDADAFDVVVLPEPARLDARARPELSWLALPFFAGQPRSFANPPLVDRFGGGSPRDAPTGTRSVLGRSGRERPPSRITNRCSRGLGMLPMAFLRSTPSFSLTGPTDGVRTVPGRSRGRPGGRRPIVSTAAKRPAQFRLPVRCRARPRRARTLLPAGRSGRARTCRRRTARSGCR